MFPVIEYVFLMKKNTPLAPILAAFRKTLEKTGHVIDGQLMRMLFDYYDTGPIDFFCLDPNKHGFVERFFIQDRSKNQPTSG